MGRCRMVDPELVRLPLSDGDFLDVKRALTAGEQREVFIQQIKGVVTSGRATELDPRKMGVTRICAYVVGWSLVDQAGRPLPFSEATLLLQDSDTYREIGDAIDAHVEAEERRQAERKTNPIFASVSSAT